jgi:hypothetical protein
VKAAPEKLKLDAEAMLASLEEVAQRLGIQVRYEKLAGGPIKTTAGSCRVRGEDVVLIDRRLSVPDKVHALGQELSRFDLEDVFIPPAARRFITGDKPEE